MPLYGGDDPLLQVHRTLARCREDFLSLIYELTGLGIKLHQQSQEKSEHLDKSCTMFKALEGWRLLMAFMYGPLYTTAQDQLHRADAKQYRQCLAAQAGKLTSAQKLTAKLVSILQTSWEMAAGRIEGELAALLYVLVSLFLHCRSWRVISRYKTVSIY